MSIVIGDRTSAPPPLIYLHLNDHGVLYIIYLLAACWEAMKLQEVHGINAKKAIKNILQRNNYKPRLNVNKSLYAKQVN